MNNNDWTIEVTNDSTSIEAPTYTVCTNVSNEDAIYLVNAKRLYETLRTLHDLQNGSPMCDDRSVKEWETVMQQAKALFEEIETPGTGYALARISKGKYIDIDPSTVKYVPAYEVANYSDFNIAMRAGIEDGVYQRIIGYVYFGFNKKVYYFSADHAHISLSNLTVVFIQSWDEESEQFTQDYLLFDLRKRWGNYEKWLTSP